MTHLRPAPTAATPWHAADAASPWAAASAALVLVGHASVLAADLLLPRAVARLDAGTFGAQQLAATVALHVAPMALRPLRAAVNARWEADVTARLEGRIAATCSGDARRWLEGRAAPPTTQSLPWLISTAVGLCTEAFDLAVELAATACVLGVLYGVGAGCGLLGAAALAAGAGAVIEAVRVPPAAGDGAPARQFARVRQGIWDNVLLGNVVHAAAWADALGAARHALAGESWTHAARDGVGTGAFQMLLGGAAATLLVADVRGRVPRADAAAAWTTTLPLARRTVSSLRRASQIVSLLPRLHAHRGAMARGFEELTRPATLDPLAHVGRAVRVDDGGDARGLLDRLDGRPHGRWTVEGPNGAGKTMLLVHLKAQLGPRAYFWPAQHDLIFAASVGSTGQRMRADLQALAADLEQMSACDTLLLDEWDANLDDTARAAVLADLARLGERRRVIDISHRNGAER